MRAVRNNPNRAHNYFQDFSKCLSIFNKSLKLQKNRKTKQEKRERERLTWRPPSRPTCRPSPATAPASCLAWPGRQAAARRRAQHACHAAARCLAAPLVELSTWDDPPLSLPNLADTRPPLWLLSLALPDVARDITVTAAHRSRDQRRPRALSPCPDGSSSSTTSTSQAARCWSPCIIPAAVVFNLGPPRSPSSSRPHRAFPEHADLPCRFPVSC